jgi:hypothetical protein
VTTAERPGARPGSGTQSQSASSGQRPAGATTTARPPRPTAASAQRFSGPRTVRLSLGRIDPWSAMKLGFLLSVAMGIVMVMVTVVLWLTLSGMGVFDDVSKTIGDIEGSASKAKFNLMDYIGFSRVTSLATVIAVIDVFLLTAIAALGAFLYNISAGLVGGVQLTLTDD